MKYFIAALMFFSFSCGSSRQTISPPAEQTLPKNISLNGKLFSALFHQRAAEYRALCLQAYNIARLRIDTYNPSSQKPKAIITDIDETILDNSPYAVHQALRGLEYVAADWFAWTDKAAADTMPGAAALLKYAASKNIKIFYVTNREERERSGTLKNLRRFDLPDADEQHLFTRKTVSSKEDRRQSVMSEYEVVLLMGDNLADFTSMFDKKTEDIRNFSVDYLADYFGSKFILLPNVNYGDWESSLYRYNYNFTQSQKDSVMQSVLKGY